MVAGLRTLAYEGYCWSLGGLCCLSGLGDVSCRLADPLRVIMRMGYALVCSRQLLLAGEGEVGRA